VKHSAVTVPAYINNAQRQATKNAAVISCTTVQYLLNQPTIAAAWAALYSPSQQTGSMSSATHREALPQTIVSLLDDGNDILSLQGTLWSLTLYVDLRLPEGRRSDCTALVDSRVGPCYTLSAINTVSLTLSELLLHGSKRDSACSDPPCHI
jgi:hypothetical protein